MARKLTTDEEVKAAIAKAKETGNEDLARIIAKLKEERDAFWKLDREAATYVETPIVMRTHFTGEPPYVGWKGIGKALVEVLDENVALKEKLAAMKADAAPSP